MEKPKIIAYLKPSCGWSQGVRAVKSGQMLSPCVEVNGHLLADVSGEEVEAYLLAKTIVSPNARDADAPTNQPCAHETPQGAPMFFQR